MDSQSPSSQEPEARLEADTAMVNCTVAGLRHVLGKTLPSALFRLDDRVDLQRESKNVEDTFAVRVMHNDKKIGYLPKPHSTAIARQLDGGDVLNGKIDTIDDTTVNIRLAIWVSL